MSDAELRRLETRGDPVALLRYRLRHGLLVPAYTEAREVACQGTVCASPFDTGDELVNAETGESIGIVQGCPSCRGTGTVPYDPVDLLRLRAYCGDEAAREVEPAYDATDRFLAGLEHPHPFASAMFVPLDTPSWANEATRLAAKLPPAQRPIPCSHRALSRTLDSCPNAEDGCTGQVTHDTAAERYLLVVAALEVAREAWAQMPDPRNEGDYDVWSSKVRAKQALDTCAAWVKCPCPEHEDAWEETYMALGDDVMWVPLIGRETDTIRHAADEILTPALVREVASAAILRALMEGRPS